MDTAASIENLLPATKYGGATSENTEAEYDALRWNDSRPKPTWAEILASFAIIEDSLKPRQRKKFNSLRTELEALSQSDQSKLRMAVMVEFLAEHPQFAKEKLGIDIEGDELKL